LETDISGRTKNQSKQGKPVFLFTHQDNTKTQDSDSTKRQHDGQERDNRQAETPQHKTQNKTNHTTGNLENLELFGGDDETKQQRTYKHSE